GLGQLERVDHLIEAKREIFRWYAEELDGVPGITLNHETEWARSIYWMTSILVDPACGIDRDGMRAALAAEGIDTRPTFPLISTYPIWDERRAVPAPVAAAIADRGINLPRGVTGAWPHAATRPSRTCGSAGRSRRLARRRPRTTRSRGSRSCAPATGR